MPTPSTGPIGFNDLNLELGVPATTLRSLNDAAVRTLAGTPFATPGTTISLNDLRGKSNAFTATGGTVIDSGGFRIHVFTSPGSFVVSNAGTEGTVQYLVVAGGGGGASNYNAGGAGGFRTATGFPVTATTYPITVGGGGAAGPVGNPAPNGNNGNPSIFSTITSAGGGYGSNGEGTQNNPGGPGGSGGGGWWAQGGLPTAPVPGVGNTPPVSPPQGNPGGYGYSTLGGGGGGGAGAAGGNATPSPNPYYKNGGPGGIGSPISWLPASYGTPGPAPGRYFAGGGGGSSGVPGAPPALGGAGGGGNGGVQSFTGPVGAGAPGTTNTGGGGGGAASFVNVQNGGSGGSGIVALRYPITAP